MKKNEKNAVSSSSAMPENSTPNRWHWNAQRVCEASTHCTMDIPGPYLAAHAHRAQAQRYFKDAYTAPPTRKSGETLHRALAEAWRTRA